MHCECALDSMLVAIIFTTEGRKTRELALNGVLSSSAGREGQEGNEFYHDGSLQGQGPTGSSSMGYSAASICTF